jgi:N-acetylglucosamine malate deacetylase 1
MSNPTLIIAAHPDDEVLGCGGAIAKLTAAGTEVHLAFLADGIGARNPDLSLREAELRQRRAAAAAAGRILGAASLSFDDLPDNRLDSVPLLDITQKVEALITRYRPATVFTHHAGDLNIDHRRTHQAVITACRPQRGHPVRTILCFEQPSSTEWQPPSSGQPFTPHWFIDISAVLELKLAAMDAYAEELRAWPHPRSRQGLEHLARWRGASVGCDAAEAFMLARHLQ